MLGRVDVVVLAGGRAARLGGVDKVSLPLAGRSSLDRLLEACAGAARVVAVGPWRRTEVPVTWCREDPPGSGPLAAVGAALPHTSADVVVVVAGDMPLAGAALPPLVAALFDADEYDAAALQDEDGRLQPLATAYRRTALVRRFAAIGDPADRPARLMLDGLRIAAVPVAGSARDIDTWDDVRRIEAELHRAH